ncbi:hypothetical protein SsS58_08184 [Streptomyces scabiei]|uniref:Uncharacterized protein n=2 Tax=Streptomyces scabiei TaxID=1930 RepID=A0A117EGV9_STRSC|nr:hypothetical protein SsS58_08184 [Streptomyces scabiei]
MGPDNRHNVPMTLKPWAWAGLAIAGVGVVTLVGFAFVDLGSADQIASVAGGSAGVIGLVLAAIVQFGGSSTPPAPPTPTPSRNVDASGVGAIAAGGSIGTVSTGASSVTPPAPASVPSASAAPADGVTASGHGAIAAGGNIGSASTGGTVPPTAPPPAPPAATPPPSAAPGPTANVTAAGPGSIAAGGDIGSASTGA